MRERKLSRRDFLRLSTMTAASTVLAGCVTTIPPVILIDKATELTEPQREMYKEETSTTAAGSLTDKCRLAIDTSENYPEL